jgi:hypothetical protein
VLQVAAGTVYWEWQRSISAGEAKKEAEKQERLVWEADAERQRAVCCPIPACDHC